MGLRCRALGGVLLAFAIGGFDEAAVIGAEPPINPWRNRPDVPEIADPILVSDLDDSSEEARLDYDYQIDTSADLYVAEQAQFQSGGGMRGGAGSRTAATTSLSRSNQRTPQFFTVRLARAPNMMGDFFSPPGSPSQVLQSLGQIGVADGGPGVFAPQGPFQVVSTVIEDSGSYFYQYGPPVPFGELLIDSQSEINSDGIPDFTLSADPSKSATSGFEPGITYAAISNGIITPSTHDLYDLFAVYEIMIPNPSAGNLVGRTRIQDNNSPLPRDRVFLDYNYFHNARLTSPGIDVNRFAPGFERTFWYQQASIEVRVPMAVTLDNNLLADGVTNSSSNQFGNLSLVAKFLLAANETTAFATGLGVSAPTAGDLGVGLTDGTQLVRIDNDSTHVIPYLAILCTPENSNWFLQSFLTFDFDTTGNDVLANVDGNGLQEVGTLRDQNLATLSVATGSWFYENYSAGSLLRRIGWQAEAHYTQTLNDSDSITSGGFQIGDPNAELSLVNGTFGLNFQVGKTIITTGYSVPLTSEDRVFDGEVRAFVNRYF